MIQFSLFGIPVRVEPWFWISLAVLGGGFNALQSSSASALLGVAMFVLAGFISILVHEFGHALTIKKYGLPTQVALIAFGGYASYPAGVLSRKQSFLVTAAGPAIQLVLGVAALMALRHLPELGGQLDNFIFSLALISLFWAIFNCLPIFPLDGGQMLAAILGPRRAKGLHLTGMITAGLVGVWALLYGQIFVAMFMGFFIYQNFQYFQQSK